MGAAASCRVCDLEEGCSCRNGLSRFIKILTTVNDRVSTLKDASQNIFKDAPFEPSAGLAFDKLCLELLNPISLEEMLKQLHENGVATRQTRLNDRKWYIELFDGTRGFYFQIAHGPPQTIWKLISRPSAYDSYQEYLGDLRRLLPEEQIAELRITRLDLAIDYSAPLRSILRSLDIPHKQSRVAFHDHGSVRTGMLVGKGLEKISVYDKKRESGLTRDVTRIEFQFSGRQLPTRRLNRLQSDLIKWLPKSIIAKVELFHVETLTNLFEAATPQGQRVFKLNHLIDREGLLATRRHLNQNGNFDRDYRPLLRLTPWHSQISDVFHSQLNTYFNAETIGGLHEQR